MSHIPGKSEMRTGDMRQKINYVRPYGKHLCLYDKKHLSQVTKPQVGVAGVSKREGLGRDVL